MSFDAGIGAAASHTDGLRKEGRSTAGAAVDLTLALRLHPQSRNGLVVGVNASAQGPIGFDDSCVLAPDLTCLPSHPSFVIYSALGGWESRTSTVRVMSGPGVALSGGDRAALALQSHVAVAFPIMRHVALVGWLRGTLIPNHQGDTFELGGAGVGLRVR